MKIITLGMLPFILLFYSCSHSAKNDSKETWKSEIMATEKEFAEMAQKDGIPEAFPAYAAEDAVVLRKNSLVIGKESIRAFYTNKIQGTVKESLSWKPDFVDVSASGDLGYTYGKYVYQSTDSTGKTKVAEGIFHTVWKRQADGKWRFVWD